MQLSMKNNKYIFPIFSILIFLFIFVYALLLTWPVKCNHMNQYVTIKKNSNVNDVAQILENNLCINRNLFKIVIKLTGNDKNIRYGRYNFKSTNNMKDLINLLTSNNNEKIKITIIEGLRLKDVALYLERKLKIDIEYFIELCYNKSFISSLGLDAANLEGYLYPDTYLLLKNYTEEDILRIMVNQFIYNYNENISENKLDMHEIVTLASIVQWEAMYDDEMKLISSVYHNRLNKNMLLQADPTIQYILPERKKRLLKKHTRIDNPYNTYLYKGLPPGPINNPGIMAIIAAAYPDKSNYFYFVSDNKGRHIFNTTFKGHLQSKK